MEGAVAIAIDNLPGFGEADVGSEPFPCWHIRKVVLLAAADLLVGKTTLDQNLREFGTVDCSVGMKSAVGITSDDSLIANVVDRD